MTGFALIMLLAITLTACGSAEPAPVESSDSGGQVVVGTDGVQSITLVAGDDYRFVPSEFTVAPGRVAVTLQNTATQLTHSLAYPLGRSPTDIAESIPVVAPGESDTIEFTVNSPGEYSFICTFHEALGHTGVMTVAA